MLISEIREINKSLTDQDLLEMQSGGKSFRVSFVKFYNWIKQNLNLSDVAYTGNFQDLSNIPPLPTRGYIDSRDQETFNKAKGYTDSVASLKVDKESGKGLSSNDYSDSDKGKMDSIQYGATRLSPATSSTLGGIKVGQNLNILSDGTLSARPDSQVNSDWNATEGVAEILNKPDLSVLATSEYVDEQVEESKEYTDTVVGNIDYSEFATKDGVDEKLLLKVDKEEGKQLSTENYTTAEKAKLLGVEVGAQVNPTPVDNLLSDDVSYPLSARQGKVLKGFIDTINDILISDDTNLDELQEIVDFIKLNREDLDSLTISSIAGLDDALSNKQPLSSILTDTSASFTTILLSKLNSIEANAQVNTVDSVAGKAGVVVLNKTDVGLSNVDNTSDVNKPISSATQAALSDKVDKEVGKQLSTEDFTTTEKSKLSGIAVGATQNAPDASLRDRATHTGVQPISSVEGLQTSLNTKASVQALQDLDDSLATVAKSGDYDNLVNKPTIPEAQVNANWNSTSGVSQILNKPTLGTAASQNVGAFATASQGVLADTAVQPSDLTPYTLTEDVPQNTDELPEGVINKFVTQAEKDKIAGLEGSHYRGLFISLTELTSQVVSPLAGDYADVDEGVGYNILRYIWDESDSQWVPQAGESAPITASQVKSLYESNPNTNAFTDAQDAKLSGIQTGATANATNAELRNRATHTGTQSINSVVGLQTALDGIPSLVSELENDSGYLTEEVDPTVPAWAKESTKPSYTKDDVGLDKVDNTSDADKPVSSAAQIAFNLKVDKQAGLGLSEESYTTQEKTKLVGIEEEATKNSTDSYLLSRANHTGTQSIGTIEGLEDALADAGQVKTVAGESPDSNGNVSLSKSSVGLDQVDNTSDADKPISSAQLAALNNKANNDDLIGLATETWVENKNYLTTHQDITGKVDKQTGYGLSQENYSLTEKNKLSGIESGAQVNAVPIDNLITPDATVPLSANQGRALKGLIDGINTILQSNDTDLDELQEIVDFIKLNREDLDSLSIESIAGLSTALNNKQPLATVLTGTTASFTTTLLTKLNGIAAEATNTASPVQSDWNASTGLAYIQNKPVFKTVNGAVITGTGDIATPNTTYAAGTGLGLSGSTFSVSYGTGTGTAAQGNDSRINNGQTAYGWGNHASAGYASSTELTSGLGQKVDKQTGYGLSQENYTLTEKNKLSGIASGATNTAAPVQSDWNASSGLAAIQNKPAIPTIPGVATTSANGLMSSGDKTKLNGIATGATANTGTVTSVQATVPTGLSVSGGPITTSGTLAFSYTTGYSIPTNAKQTQWDSAYGWGDHASAGYATTSALTSGLSGKVDTQAGYGLSQANYTTAEKTKLAEVGYVSILTSYAQILSQHSGSLIIGSAGTPLSLPTGLPVGFRLDIVGPLSVLTTGGDTLRSQDGISSVVEDGGATLIKFNTNTWWLAGNLE